MPFNTLGWNITTKIIKVVRLCHKVLCYSICVGKLDDGTITVLVNPYYEGDEISEELKAFLEYVRTGGIDSNDSFTSKIDNLVDELKRRSDWRSEYMTLYEMIEEAKAEGKAEGEAKVLAAAEKLGFDIDAIIAEVKSAEKN